MTSCRLSSYTFLAHSTGDTHIQSHGPARGDSWRCVAPRRLQQECGWVACALDTDAAPSIPFLTRVISEQMQHAHGSLRRNSTSGNWLVWCPHSADNDDPPTTTQTPSATIGHIIKNDPFLPDNIGPFSVSRQTLPTRLTS